jgi:putative sigma-54 modulation protein
MNLSIRGNDIQISDEIRNRANVHANRLDRIADHLVDAKLELRHLPQKTGDVVVAQVTMQTGKVLHRAEERDPDALKAIDRAMEKIERQLRRYHEKRADRHGRRIPDIAAVHDGPVDEGDEEAAVVRTKRFPVKPMDIDEAIEQMELLGHDFFLFRNIEASEISLVYRRKDGSYGLLVPEPM